MPANEEGSEQPEMRELSDARTFRALAHPVRLSLLETLFLEGPLTATEAGERIGESPTTCSFHLRQLAKYGFVEEAGGGRGRARPWRLSTVGTSYSNVHDDTETELAAGALTRLLRERALTRYRSWLETKASYPADWRKAAGDSELVLWVTPAELQEINQELLGLLLPRYHERLSDPSTRPEGSLPVEILVLSYPVVPPAKA